MGVTIAEGLNAAVNRGEIAGAVALVTDAEETLFIGAVGLSNVAGNEEMTPDAMFCIASMTKPVTAAAVLVLQDEGKLSLDDPLEKHLPEFTQLKNAGGERVSVTLRQCLAHTSGMSDVSLEEENRAEKLEDLIPMILEKPTLFDPGERWEYCQTSINMAAHVVEVMTGQSFPDFMQERFFGPLGMKDTSFYPTEEQVARLARCYSRTESDGWRDDGWSWITHNRMMDPSRYPKANAGLFSTASDYALFCRMLLKRGSSMGGGISVSKAFRKCRQCSLKIWRRVLLRGMLGEWVVVLSVNRKVPRRACLQVVMVMADFMELRPGSTRLREELIF